MRNTSTNKTNARDRNPETPFIKECKSQLVMELSDGRTIVLNLAPLAEIFSYYSDLQPVDFEREFNKSMDALVEGYSTRMGLEVEEMQGSYMWLKYWRNAFKEITWRELPAED